MRNLAIGTAVSCLLLPAPAVRSQAPQGGAPQAPARPAYPQDTPEAAFRSFLLTMAVGDEPAVRRLALPDEDFAFLLKGEHLPPGQAEAFRKEVVDKIVLKRLKAGDEVKLANGRVLKIAPEEVGEGRAVLLPEGGPPLPLFAYRFKEGWMLDARPIIAGRKAADAARRAAEKKAGN